MVSEFDSLTQDKIPDFDDLSDEQKAILESFEQDAPKSVGEKLPTFVWDDTTQRSILSSILCDYDILKAIRPVLEPGYFSNEAHVIATKLLFAFSDQYGGLPDKGYLQSELREALADREPEIKIAFLGELVRVQDYFVPGLVTRQALVAKVRTFARQQAGKVAFHKYATACTEAPDKIDEAEAAVMAAFREIRRHSGTTSTDRPLTPQELLNLPETDWLIDNHFPANTMGLIYGPFASLKSFLALDMALSLATGRPFLGTHPVQQCEVVYVAGEGADGVAKRFKAWLQHHGVAELPANFRPWFTRFDLCKPGEAERLLATLEQEGIKTRFVIIDTVAKNMVGDEKDSKDASAFIAAMDVIREGLDGATVVGVTHMGKDASRGVRGSTAFPAGVDVLFEVTRTANGCKIRCDKQKDAEELAPYLLNSEIVPLGHDSKGRPLSSLVLVGVDPATATAEAPDPAPSTARLKLEAEIAAFVGLLQQADATSRGKALGRADIMARLDWTGKHFEAVSNAVRQEAAGPICWLKTGPATNSPVVYWLEVVQPQ